MLDTNNQTAVRQLLFKLLTSDREEQVVSALKAAGLWDHKASWRLLGIGMTTTRRSVLKRSSLKQRSRRRSRMRSTRF